MNKSEHLLTILGEECNEIAHRISKALRFGLQEKQKKQDLTNQQRIEEEIGDLFGVIEILKDEKILELNEEEVKSQMDLKKIKIKKYVEYAKEIGTLKNK
jgi:NTP pyrophosphatase (non-canonical NTP hydrolase)